MFDKLKQLHQLKNLQNEFKRQTVSVENNGVVITLNGNFEVLEVILNPALDIPAQQLAIKAAANGAREKIQKELAQKMMGSGMSF